MALLPRCLLRSASMSSRGHIALPTSRLAVYQQSRWHSGPLYKNPNKTPSEAESPTLPQNLAGRETLSRPDPESYEAPREAVANPHRQFYKTFGFPVLRVVLGALFTYQILYWSWLKLESLDNDENVKTEVHGLKQKLVDAVRDSKADDKS